MKAQTSTHLLALIGGLLLLGACAQGVDKVTANAVTTEQVESAIAPTRLCTDIMSTATPSKLFSFFGYVVRNLEGPPTFCLDLAETGNASNLKAELRLEYEDDKGIRYFTIGAADTYFGSVAIESGKQVVEIVWIDAVGFIQVKATETSAGSGVMSGNIKYYNFPSYADQLAAAAAEAARKCKDKEWTVAECYGYQGPNTNWWQTTNTQTPRQQLINAAKAILNDSSKTSTLSKISFEL